MLESEIKKLTAAVTELTAALHTVRLPTTTGATAITPATPAPAPKAQDTTETAPAAAPAPAPTVEVETPTAEVVKAPTKKQLVEKFIELAQSKDREVAVKLLADFGVSKLPELTDKAKWPEFIVAVDAILAG